MEYNYKHFGFQEYDLEHFEGPKVGTKAPDFSALTLDKKTLRLSDFQGKIVVLENGSLTCPATAGTTSDMQEFVRQFPDIVFLLLYVREAHPGERIPLHASFEDKFLCAKRFQEEEKDNRIILVDDLEGTIHKQYGLFPNFIYVIDPKGYVAFRTPWNVPKRLQEVLSHMRKYPAARIPEKYLLPDIKHVGFRAIKRAGWRAALDLIPNIINGIRVRSRLKRLARSM